MKIPAFIIIPHGGYQVPEEMADYSTLNQFDCFMEADTSANEIFNLSGETLGFIDSQVSRLFIDLDRPAYSMPPVSDDGVIKIQTSGGKDVFRENCFPDEIALASMLKRYYFPFHATIDKIIKTGEPAILLECHTMMPVAPANAIDAGKPRPLIIVEDRVETRDKTVRTCPENLSEDLTNELVKSFRDEDTTAAGRAITGEPRRNRFILGKYGRGKIPMLRVSISRSLFINEKDFSYEFMSVNPLRIENLREKFLTALHRFMHKNF